MNDTHGGRSGSGRAGRFWIVAAVGMALTAGWVASGQERLTDMTFEEWAKLRGVTSTRGASRPAVSRPAPVAERPVASKPAAPMVTQADFQRVMDQKCVRCHRPQLSTVGDQRRVRWILPGKPESSPTYTVIGVNRNPNGTYHNLSDADKKIVHDFIEQLKP